MTCSKCDGKGLLLVAYQAVVKGGLDTPWKQIKCGTCNGKGYTIPKERM